MMVRSRASLLLEFDQLLNLLFPGKPSSEGFAFNDRILEGAFQGFYRDASGVVAKDELRQHALNDWLARRSNSSKPEVEKSLKELLDSQFPS